MLTPNEFAGQACGVYPRVSTRKQAKKDKASLDDQLQACRDYARQQGMHVDEACVQKEAFTSTVMQRPRLNTLLRTMQERGVRHLVIDRVDRLTREGQLAAATFLEQFTQAGITLHIVSLSIDSDDDDLDDDDDASLRALVVRTDKDVKDFLDAAYAAQQENKRRAKIVRRAKRRYAQQGRYNRGNKAHFGYVYEPCAYYDDGHVQDKKLAPDVRSYAALGYPGALLFAPTPYATRLEMLRLRAEEGLSYARIAGRLRVAGVPTPWQLVGRKGAEARWDASTVNHICNDPINEGRLLNFRTTKQIVVQPAHGGPAPLLDERTASLLATRNATARTQRGRSGLPTSTAGALLGHGLARCGRCGGGMRVYAARRRRTVYLYYRCRRHELDATACPGLNLSAVVVDPGAWFAAVEALVALDNGYRAPGPNGGSPDSYLDQLVRAETARLTADGRLAQQEQAGAEDASYHALRAVRDDVQLRAARLVGELSRTPSQLGRDLIQDDLTKLDHLLTEANKKLAAHERQRARTAERRRVLVDFLEQWDRTSRLVLALDPSRPEDVPVMASILGMVGAQVTLDKDAHGDPTTAVALTLSPTATLPWFSQEDMARLLDERRRPVLSWPTTTPDQAQPPVLPVYRPFTAPSSSSAQTRRRTSGNSSRQPARSARESRPPAQPAAAPA